MPFQKGNTYGNRDGRPPKGQATAEILRAKGDLPWRPGSDQTRRDRAAEVVWEQACKGNLQAFAWITDRTEGKVTDKVQQDIQVTELSPEERAQRVKALYALARRRQREAADGA